MKLYKLALLVLTAVSLTACGAPTAVNPDSGKETAEFLKDTLDRDVDLAVTKEEYGTGIIDVYALGTDVKVVMNDEQGVEQIEFDQLNEQEVLDTLKLVDFPEATTINTALSTAGKNQIVSNRTYFTEYKGTGVVIMGDYKATMATPNPYRLIIVYNEDRFAALEKSDID